MTNFESKVLKYLNINEEELPSLLKEVTYDDIENPYDFLNMEKAVERIKKAIENKEKIMIYGDYDCDGISATAILVKMFSYFNIKVGYYIPSRYIDGYGINLTRAEQIEDKGYSLVITVDNGVAASEAIEYLESKNIDVILTDHHEITRELPKCYTVIHPDLKSSGSTLKQCGAYVAFMLATSLLNRVDDYLLVLAMQATISDMMPLRSYNRDLIKLGLKIINNHHEYPHFKLTNNYVIDEDTLGFQICPKINAFGRIRENKSVNDMVKFFITNIDREQELLAREIEQVNNERKTILSNVVNNIDLSLYQDKKIIIERFDDVSEGVIGLIAARILNETNKPCAIFTKIHDQDILKGSARSIKGFSLSEAFGKTKDLLLVYGGHEEAGGLSLLVDNFSSFKEKMEDLCEKATLIKEDEKYIEVDKDEITYQNYCFIKKLSPFGMDYNKPKFLLKTNNVQVMYIGNNHQHIKGFLSKNASFVGFNLAHLVNDNNLTFVGNINYDDFKKGENVVFLIDKII